MNSGDLLGSEAGAAEGESDQSGTPDEVHMHFSIDLHITFLLFIFLFVYFLV